MRRTSSGKARWHRWCTLVNYGPALALRSQRRNGGHCTGCQPCRCCRPGSCPGRHHLLQCVDQCRGYCDCRLGHDAGYCIRQLRPVGWRNGRVSPRASRFTLVPTVGVPVSIVHWADRGRNHRPVQRYHHHRAARYPPSSPHWACLSVVAWDDAAPIPMAVTCYLQGYPGYRILSGGHILGIPMPVIIALALAALLGLVISHTRFGRYVLGGRAAT